MMNKKMRGFTLLEVIITVTILAIVMTVVYSSITSILRSKVLLEDEQELQETATSILSRLTRELQVVTRSIPLLPPCGENESGDKKNRYFNGEKNGDLKSRGDKITFIASGASQFIPNGRTNTGNVQITFQVAPDPENNNKLSLFREEIPYKRPIETACENRIAFPISASIDSLEFNYFDGQDGKWYDEWDGEEKQGLPELIGYKLKLVSPRGVIREFSSMVSTVELK